MNWHTEVRKISELKNWESNPRTISEESYKTLKKSIGDLGNFEPLVINIDGTVLAGNQRLRVHKEQGDTEVEVSVPERELTEEEIKKIGIISNRHSGEWDMDRLANEFEDVLQELGFDDLLPEAELDVEEDDYEEPDDLEIKVKTGEVWQLGKHRLMCGDSTKIEDVEKLMNGQKADMVFTDPPYGIGYSGRGENTSNKILGDNTDPTEFYNVGFDIPDGYVWGRVENYKHLLEAPRDVIVWKKNNFGMGRGYRGQYEVCFYYGSFSGSDSDVWEVDKDTNYKHPTQKPIALCVRAIKNSNPVSVIDYFGGSGSTLIACEQTNRVCYMMELDEHYATVILDRWEKLTGEQGVKLED